MNGGLIHNKKFNLVAFLSMGLFLLIGFIGHCPKFCVNGNRIQL